MAIVKKGERKVRNLEPIDNLLKKYNPSELDEAVKTACPFYESSNQSFTGAYLDFHEYAKVGILSRLQVELEELEIYAEEETGNGRVDGSVRKIGLKNNDVCLYDEEGKPAEKIALIEVKTGNLKPLQAATYTYTERTPCIIAEIKNGSCHLIDLETAEKLLGYAKSQIDTLEQLRKKNERIPDPYRCKSCASRSCEHQRSEGSAPDTKFIIKNRTDQLTDNLSHTVEELVRIVESLLEEEGFSTLR